MAIVAFFGLGSMGLPMAINLLKAGHEVRVMVHKNTSVLHKYSGWLSLRLFRMTLSAAVYATLSTSL